jgi:hypothetical protein
VTQHIQDVQDVIPVRRGFQLAEVAHEEHMDVSLAPPRAKATTNFGDVLPEKRVRVLVLSA